MFSKENGKDILSGKIYVVDIIFGYTNESLCREFSKCKFIEEEIINESCILAILEELNQFKRNGVWDLVPCPQGKSVIGTKQIFWNKINENGNLYK